MPRRARRGFRGLNRYKLDEALASEILLLGRVTYETLGAWWREADGPFADKLNAMPKYVLSTTLERADWTNSTVLRGELVTDVTRLRETVAGDIVVYGSVQLVRGLIEHGLLDDVVMVVAVAQGADDAREVDHALAEVGEARVEAAAGRGGHAVLDVEEREAVLLARAPVERVDAAEDHPEQVGLEPYEPRVGAVEQDLNSDSPAHGSRPNSQ